MAVSYLTTNTLIESVKNRALIPTTQQTFTPADFLRFANEEMMMGVVPLVEQFHEEFFIFEETTPIIPGQRSYEIPYRATGNKLRSIYLLDSQQNRYPLTRVFADDLEYYQGNGYGQSIYAFYIANNCVNLLNVPSQDSNSKLLFSYYMRPNSLVDESRVARIASIAPTANLKFNPRTGFQLDSNTLVVPSHGLKNGSVISFESNFNYSLPYPLEYNRNYYVKNVNINTIGLYNDSLLTEEVYIRNVWESDPGQVSVINSTISFVSDTYYDELPDGLSGFFTPTPSQTIPSPLVAYSNSYFLKRESGHTYSIYTDAALTNRVILSSAGSDTFTFTHPVNADENTVSIKVTTYDITLTTNAAPNVFNLISKYDFIQANSPHKTLGYDRTCTSITGNLIRIEKEEFRAYLNNYNNAPAYNIPKPGDIVAVAGETIVPQIPDELHSMLAQRIACRCLEALGDREGLAAANAKLAEMESKSAILINDRVEGSPQKVVNHNSPLRQRFIGSRITRS